MQSQKDVISENKTCRLTSRDPGLFNTSDLIDSESVIPDYVAANLLCSEYKFQHRDADIFQLMRR